MPTKETGPSRAELAVACTVVALAVAALGPVIADDLQDPQGKERTCQSNMKQIGLGLLQYTQDYDECLPPPLGGAPQGWAGRIVPYIKSYAVFKCPNDPTPGDASLQPPAVPVSYALNSNLVSLTAAARSKPIPLAQFDSPAVTACVYEIGGDSAQIASSDEGTRGYRAAPRSGYLSAAGDGAGPAPEWGHVGTGASALSAATGPLGGRAGTGGQPRHDGGSNFEAADGHVIWLRPGQVSSGTTNPTSGGAQDQPRGAAAGTGGVGSGGAPFKLTFSPR